ncbi:hypothetical protein JB92DRAFT_2843987 [Gautieria morchelliformis]|nr:hypothetical protein JB92DRAFT_2843987 [Gautieria morchelliformis]
MRIPVLCSVVALVELSTVAVAADPSTESDAVTPCRARAWVRAPDLEPGQVVQGDVKVKLDGVCEEVSSYTLGLRFAERAWVKTRREGVKLPARPAANHSRVPTNRSIFEPDTLFSTRFPNYLGVDNSVWDKYQDEIKDPSLWLVREEERVGFEAKYGLRHGKQIGHDLVESFAILVPSTSYPPGFQTGSRSYPSNSEPDAAGSEHIYAYFVDVAFMNGTTLEVPAGYTSFKDVTVAIPLQETVNVSATSLPWPAHGNPNDKAVAPEDVDVFTLEVTFQDGRPFEQGSVHNITVASHQVGPGIERPDSIVRTTLFVSQKRHWAAGMAVNNTIAESLLDAGEHHNSQLVPTNPQPRSARSWCLEAENTLTDPEFPQDGVVKKGTMFSTEPIIAQVHVPEDRLGPFEMHYQTIAVELFIRMTVRNITSSVSVEDSEEYGWIPTMKQATTIPTRVFSARIPILGQGKLDKWIARTGTAEMVHYLSPEARAPVFVDPASAQDLLQKSSEERDEFAPKAQPTFVTHSDHDVVKDRYFVWRPNQEGMYYVGDTWLRKVVEPGMKDHTEPQAVFRVQ